MDKIARIRQEIDKRYQEYRAKMKTEDFTYYEGMADALDLFEQFVDTLSEEHDKSLEEAAIEYATDTIPLTDEVYIDARIKASFIAGAEWQKEQKRNIEICPHSIKSKSYSMQKKQEGQR